MRKASDPTSVLRNRNCPYKGMEGDAKGAAAGVSSADAPDRKLTRGSLGGGRSRKGVGSDPERSDLDRAIAGATLARDRNRSS